MVHRTFQAATPARSARTRFSGAAPASVRSPKRTPQLDQRRESKTGWDGEVKFKTKPIRRVLDFIVQLVAAQNMDDDKRSTPVKGVYAALATPRRQNAIEIDAAALLDYLDTVVASGVDGIVLFGSTGEFIHFDTEERMKVLSLAIKRSRVPLLVNISHSTLDGALSLAENAINSEVAGILLMPPYFYRYTDDQVFRFYEKFAASIGGKTRIYLYNLPFFTNPMSPDLAVRLLSSGWFAGIKDSSGDWALFQVLAELLARTPFTLLVGNETLYLRGRLAGAAGSISGVAAAVPELPVAMDRAISAGDIASAEHLDIHLQEFVSWIRKLPSTVAIKQAAVARGWKLDHYAFSLDSGTNANLEQFREWFQGWLPSVLAECREVALAKA